MPPRQGNRENPANNNDNAQEAPAEQANQAEGNNNANPAPEQPTPAPTDAQRELDDFNGFPTQMLEQNRRQINSLLGDGVFNEDDEERLLQAKAETHLALEELNRLKVENQIAEERNKLNPQKKPKLTKHQHRLEKIQRNQEIINAKRELKETRQASGGNVVENFVGNTGRGFWKGLWNNEFTTEDLSGVKTRPVLTTTVSSLAGKTANEFVTFPFRSAAGFYRGAFRGNLPQDKNEDGSDKNPSVGSKVGAAFGTAGRLVAWEAPKKIVQGATGPIRQLFKRKKK